MAEHQRLPQGTVEEEMALMKELLALPFEALVAGVLRGIDAMAVHLGPACCVATIATIQEKVKREAIASNLWDQAEFDALRAHSANSPWPAHLRGLGKDS